MKNIMKIIVALFTSVSLISSVSAGEMTVTGKAKATYNILKGGSVGNAGKGIGVANEIDFGAKGDLDNGMSWNYQVQFDPGATTNNGGVDDTRLELTTTFGTLGVYVSEGGLDTDNSASQSVYGRPSDIGLSTGMKDGPAISSFNNLQYHLPAGTLPFGGTFKAAYATDQSAGMNGADGKGGSHDHYCQSAEQFQVTAAPLDGLKIFADYYKESGASANVIQAFEAGSVAATYAFGPASFGASRTLNAPLMTSATSDLTAINNATTAGGNPGSARLYTTNKMSVAYNVNSDLSVSYEIEKSNRETIAAGTDFDIKASALQAAYTMGGMTLAISHGKTDNVNYTDANDAEQTLFAVTMAF